MSGTRITDQQARLYMSKRKHHSQEIAAAKAGISVRSARRVERDALLPSQKPRRYWRSRPDPFVVDGGRNPHKSGGVMKSWRDATGKVEVAEMINGW